MNVAVRFKTWGGQKETIRNVVLVLPEELGAQLIEAAACEQPAGLPEKICNVLNAAAALFGEKLDYVTEAKEEPMMTTQIMQRIIKAMQDGGLCGICRNNEPQQKVCEAILESGQCIAECKKCSAILERPCKACFLETWGSGFEWNGKVQDDA